MLKNKTAVITGGSRGIGREIAIKFAESGANIAIIYSGNKEKAEEVCGIIQKLGANAKCYRCDISNFEQTGEVCKKIVSDFGGADILVNNAGIAKDNLFIRMSEEEFTSVMDVNLKGSFNMARHLSRYIMKSASGRIINISSVAGIMGNVGQANYSASKAGLIGLTKTLAKELASRHVTCNAIAPGFIETDMTKNLPQQVNEYIKTSVPLKRMGKPDEIANLALFLASEQSSYITGEVIKIDGGMCI